MIFRRPHGVLQQHGNRHRADAAGIGRDFAGDFFHGGKIHIADQFRAGLGTGIRHAVHAHVNHRCARLDHVGLHKFRNPHRRDQDVCAPAMRLDVAGGGMTDRHRGVRAPALLAQHGRHRFADNVAAAEHDDFRAFRFHAGADQQFHDARRCAGAKARRIAEHEFADIYRMETVHVLRRQHAGINFDFGNLFRQRSLHEDAVQAGIGIQCRDERQQFAFGCRFRQDARLGKNAEFGAGFFLASDINFGRGIFAHAHKRKAGNHTALFQIRHVRAEFTLYLRGDGAAINELCWARGL